MNFSYTNLESNAVIPFSVSDEKKIIAIYGKNGVGKTTFSTQDIWDEKYVFNDIFIRKNIYVSSDNGVSTSSVNKKNLSTLFIGEDVVQLQQNQEHLLQNKKDLKDQLKDIVNDIGKSFSKRVDLSIVQSLIDQHLNQVDSMDPFLNTEDINQLSLGIEIASEILTEEEYIMNLNVFESHEKLASFVELINRDITLKRLILQDESMDIYKELVSTDDLIALLKSKDQVDQFLKERSIVINLDDGFIRTVLELQEGNEHCVICGAENRKEQVMRWKDVLDNEFQKQKNKYLSELQSLVSSIDRVWSIRESIESEVPNTLEFLRNLYIETLSIIERVKNNQFDIEVTILKPTLESISVEVSDLKNQLITFLVSNDADRLVGYSFQVQNIDNHVRKLKDELDELMATQAKSIVTEMNQIMQSMQIMRDIQVSVDRTGGNYKYKYTIDNQDIDVLSEGQRHKLALAFFLVSVKQLGLKNKTIVLDDPVVCLDELGYHVLKDIIINLRKQEETLRVIILTHNIFYLYIQLSNIFDNQSIRLQTSFFRMNSTEIREYSLDCLRIDDIALFKRALERVASEDELLIVSGIVNKIFRHFLDFLVRARGHLFNENPVDDIALLKVKVTQRKRLKQINRKISDIRKKGSGYDTKEAVELISLLQEALTILGFGDYIETSTITGLSRLIGSKNIKDELSGSDIYFDMIDAVNDVLYRNTFPELRGYLEHPRHQITKQITSISNDF